MWKLENLSCRVRRENASSFKSDNDLNNNIVVFLKNGVKKRSLKIILSFKYHYGDKNKIIYKE